MKWADYVYQLINKYPHFGFHTINFFINFLIIFSFHTFFINYLLKKYTLIKNKRFVKIIHLIKKV